jgi:hypothetical protein
VSTGWLLGVGVLVTLLVATGLALPIYGAILDGRYQKEHETADVFDLPTNRRSGRSPAA